MKKSLIYGLLFIFSFGAAFSANAQSHRNKNYRHRENHAYKHERPRHWQNSRDDRHYHKRSKYAHHYKNEHHYYAKREVAYRRYISKRHKAYRDHDRWYYAPRFYNRSEYVYFPRFKTYYDPFRRVYVYQRNRKWVYAPSMPSFMLGINLGNVSVQFLSRLPF